jgi:hypothetical protein
MTYLMSCPLSLWEKARVRASGLCNGRVLMLAPPALTPTLSRKREREQDKGALQ